MAARGPGVPEARRPKRPRAWERRLAMRRATVRTYRLPVGRRAERQAMPSGPVGVV